MIRRPPRSTRTDTLFPYTTLFRSSKRPIMGRIAAERADMVVLTNDNPRAEDPREIIEQIAAGMPGAPRVEQDRALAILSAIWSAGPEDVRSEERRVGEECVGPCSYRGAPSQ